jgi:hypothetical protein
MSIAPLNLHPIDRITRVLIGLALVTLLFVGPVPGWGLVGLLGFVLLGTAAVGSCPIYTVAGISTAERKEGEA